MPWGRNPLRDTKHKGTNSSLGSSGANWAKAGAVFNLPLLLLLRHLLQHTLGQRTLPCSTLPIHTHFQGRGSFWHEAQVPALSVTLSRGSISSAAEQELLSQPGAAGTDVPSTGIYARGASAASFTVRAFTCFHANVQSYHPHLTSVLYLEK